MHPPYPLCNFMRDVLTGGTVQETKGIKDYTQRFPDQFDKFWEKQTFAGAYSMPAQAQNRADVAPHSGASGFLSKGSLADKVKIIPVN